MCHPAQYRPAFSVSLMTLSSVEEIQRTDSCRLSISGTGRVNQVASLIIPDESGSIQVHIHVQKTPTQRAVNASRCSFGQAEIPSDRLKSCLNSLYCKNTCIDVSVWVCTTSN